MRFTLFSTKSHRNPHIDGDEHDSSCLLRRNPNSKRKAPFGAYPAGGGIQSTVRSPGRKYLYIVGLLMIGVVSRLTNKTAQEEGDESFSLFSMASSKQKSSMALRGGSSSSSSSWRSPIPSNYKLIQVQLIHRHGERSPITPNLLNETQLWPLPTNEQWDAVLNGHGDNYELIMLRSNDPNDVGPIAAASGQLTSKGLQQLIDLGRKIRQELLNHKIDPRRVVAASTDFPRTVQSAQGFLYGLLSPTTSDSSPTNDPNNEQIQPSSPLTIQLDLRHTNRMIPDPDPRRYPEMEKVEQALLQDPELTAKEGMIKEFGFFLTEKLLEAGIIGDQAFANIIGVGNDIHQSDESGKRILPWNSLAELYNCLESAKQLPEGISHTDVQSVLDYVAWRWFFLLRNEQMANWCVSSLVKKLILNVQHFIDNEIAGINTTAGAGVSSPIHTFSAHDSTLIALICAFRMNNPTKWPEYASYLKMELFQKEGTYNFFVQFSLNNEVLSSSWGLGGKTFQQGEPMRRFIPVEDLISELQNIQNNLPASLY